MRIGIRCNGFGNVRKAGLGIGDTRALDSPEKVSLVSLIYWASDIIRVELSLFATRRGAIDVGTLGVRTTLIAGGHMEICLEVVRHTRRRGPKWIVLCQSLNQCDETVRDNTLRILLKQSASTPNLRTPGSINSPVSVYIHELAHSV